MERLGFQTGEICDCSAMAGRLYSKFILSKPNHVLKGKVAVGHGLDGLYLLWLQRLSALDVEVGVKGADLDI